MESNKNLSNLRHTLAHVLAHAVLNLYGTSVKFGIGPGIDTGFYYDFEFPKPISEADLPRIEKEMRRLIKQNLEMQTETYPLARALKMMKEAGQDYKIDLLRDIQKGSRTKVKGVKTGEVSFYRLGKFLDLCKGGHLKNTSEIPADAFRLLNLAGAYWKGSEKNPMLTRVYGLGFATRNELNEHLRMLAEAEERDHKKLGLKLDLFTFSELVGAGLPLWTPRGTVLRNQLDDFVWELRKKRGYVKVEIPHITKKELYVKSGHWEKFQNELFKIKTREGHELALKPMNCPHHIQIFNRKMWSYRELPQRYANTTMQYRDEQTGELSGLARVRAITLDDAHVFCRLNQIEEEFLKIWDIIDEFYGACGFPLQMRLSFHDPKQSKKYLGDPQVWKRAENTLRELAKKRKVKAVEAVGEAAFYGPKIDFMANDSLNRQWQMATIQLDMNLPERFDLTSVNEKGERERVVMIHAAIMGSIERFLAILIEHTAGAFPVWLAPIQVAVLPISDRFNEYARQISQECGLRIADLRIEADERNESVGKKIRDAELSKIPYMLIVGEKEKTARAVNVRKRGAREQQLLSLDEFSTKLKKEIENKL